MAPIVFWGKWGTFLPRQAPMHTVVGKRIDTGPPRPDPTNEEVAAKLEEFIAEMERIFRTHREKHGYGNTELVVL